jgi:hypothetical protein
LRAEANAERRPPVAKPRFKKPQRFREEQIGMFLVGADRTAEYDEQIAIRGRRLRQEIVARIDHLDGIVALGQQLIQNAQTLEGNVPYGHRPPFHSNLGKSTLFSR